MQLAGYDRQEFVHLAEMVAPGQAKAGKLSSLVPHQPNPCGDHQDADFQEIVRQCAFIRRWVDDAARLPEPEWYAGLTIAGRCLEGEDIAHEISSRDPRYDPDETSRKLCHALEDTGPRTCRSIQADLGFEGCAECRKPERVKTPLQLGRSARAATTIEGRLHEMNEMHAVTLVGGKCVILREFVDPLTKRPDIALLSPSDFHALHANNRVEVFGPSGKRAVSVSREWMEWPKRRGYEGIIFDPSLKASPSYYNLFRGLPISPAGGDWSLMREHIRNVICDGDSEHFRYVLAWLARCVQEPGGQRPGVALVLLGKQGTGKGVFVNYFGQLFGHHYLHLTSSQQLTGKFNSHLKGALVAFSDEGVWGGDKTAEGVLKGLITEPSLFIEPKGKDGFSVANHVNLVIASNNSWVIPAGLEERRYLVLKVSENHMQDKPYFRAICEQMDRGGLEAMMHDLLHFDTSEVDLRTPPRTEALLDQTMLTMQSSTKFWHQLLVDGAFPRITEEFGKLAVVTVDKEPWPSWIETDKLHFAYLEFTRSVNDRYPLPREVFTKELMKLCRGMRTKRQSTGRGRASGICIPPLAKCREAFAAAVKFDVKWPEDEEDREDQPGTDGGATAPTQGVDSFGCVYDF